MSFDWMESVSVERDGAADFKEKFTEDCRKRAEILRRLGFSKAESLARCKSRIAWEFDFQGSSPVSDRELSALFKDVYGE